MNFITTKIASYSFLNLQFIYDFHVFTVIDSSFHRFSYELTWWLAPDCLSALLVEHCTCVTKVMGSNPIKAWIFLSPYFHHCIISVFITVKDCFQIQFLICTSPIWFYMYSKLSMGKIFALVYTTLLIIKLDFTHGYVLFLKIILSVFFLFLIEKTFELMTLHYSILQTCFRNELDP